MSVHVGEIHTELSARGTASPGTADAPEPADHRPGAHEDRWRESRARVRQREQRVCAEDFDA